MLVLSYRIVSRLTNFKMKFDTCKRRVSVTRFRFFFVCLFVCFLLFVEEYIVLYSRGSSMTHITDNVCLANFHNVDVAINSALEKGTKSVHFSRINAAKKNNKQTKKLFLIKL